MNIIIGSMTIPFSLSSKERLLWLEDWVFSSKEGILGNVIIELYFSYEADMDSSMNYLINNKSNGWTLIGLNEMFSPNGETVRFIYDSQSEEILNELKTRHD